MKKNVKSRRQETGVDFAPNIGWIVEEGIVRVFQSERGEILTLGYPEAAVWDLVSRYSSEADIVPKLAVISSLNGAGARSLLRSCLRAWLEGGILLQTEDHG